jgi:hypothetical protein
MATNGMEALDLVPSVTPAPTNVQEFLAYVGLGEPQHRAVAMALLVSAGCYIAKQPATFFTEKGTLKAFALEIDGEDDDAKTQLHFVVVPIVAFCLTYVFL